MKKIKWIWVFLLVLPIVGLGQTMEECRPLDNTDIPETVWTWFDGIMTRVDQVSTQPGIEELMADIDRYKVVKDEAPFLVPEEMDSQMSECLNTARRVLSDKLLEMESESKETEVPTETRAEDTADQADDTAERAEDTADQADDTAERAEDTPESAENAEVTSQDAVEPAEAEEDMDIALETSTNDIEVTSEPSESPAVPEETEPTVEPQSEGDIPESSEEKEDLIVQPVVSYNDPVADEVVIENDDIEVESVVEDSQEEEVPVRTASIDTGTGTLPVDPVPVSTPPADELTFRSSSHGDEVELGISSRSDSPSQPYQIPSDVIQNVEERIADAISRNDSLMDYLEDLRDTVFMSRAAVFDSMLTY